MKKLSLLIALIVCVTIGGVYATWSYAGTNDIVDGAKEIVVTLESATLSGENGHYSFDTNLVMTIDQESKSSHKAVLTMNDDAYLKIIFTPADNATVDIKGNGVASKFKFTTTTTMQYKVDADNNYSATGTAKDIFIFDNTGADENNYTSFSWTKEDNGTFTYTFDLTALKEEIKIADFILDTKAEYDEFAKVLNGNIKVMVTDGVYTG